LGNEKDYGTYGALEMAGFFIATRNENAFNRIVSYPSLYEESLEYDRCVSTSAMTFTLDCSISELTEALNDTSSA